MAIKGYRLKKAQRYLEDVIAHKDAIPFRVFTGGIGHHAQAKKYKHPNCRWPEKSCRYLLDLLQNAESNAEIQGIEIDQLYVYHIQVNRAPQLRRRTYRAHGRINPYMSSPCHVELILSQRESQIKKPDDDGEPKRKGKRRNRNNQGRLKSGATA
jgi:large subunit ribosomal protein L17e